MNDTRLKYIFNNISPAVPDNRGRPIGGKCIGFTSIHPGGPLGGIYVFPHIGGKYLYRSNPLNPLELRMVRRLDKERPRNNQFGLPRKRDSQAMRVLKTLNLLLGGSR
ncbi:hypothetical protein O9X90_25755 [Agrobacterium leguminum]|uniref:hypothetical protein n=1 Tax=Agrobacterium leguminum TaxID=2792015 RepID=UPI0022B8266E|nr:hypothetical protein [Agrobacterium leguminum]MCZ7935737.1 hypothetical protein [Agrobacterium leguminum]